jgi:competence protein ComEC
MAGGTPSAFRAVIMQAALLAGPVLKREHDAPTALSLALLVLLIQNPFAAASVSLQLSFASVTGILGVSSRLFSAMLNPVHHKLKGKGFFARTILLIYRIFCANVAVTLGAMLLTTPLIALYFGQIGLISPLTNLLTLWAVTILMICALVIGTLAVFFPALLVFPGFLAGLLGHYITAVVMFLGRLPLACLDGTNPHFQTWLLAVYLFLITIALAPKRGRQALFSLVCLILLLGAAVGLNRQTVCRADLTVTTLDVGQGASTLILSGNSAVLVDCGGKGSSSAGDLAADRLAALGRMNLDALVFTHLDDDHYNGTPQLFWRLEIDRIYLPESTTDQANLDELLCLATEEGAEVVFVSETVTFSSGTANLTLYPPLGSGTSNEEGLFALCSHEDFDLLITGDADSFVEQLLIKYYPIPDLELLLVGHHGSKHSTSTALLDALRPELAIISVGYNSYGHPAEETLSRLADAGTEVYRTDLCGSVTVTLRDGLISVS